MPTKAPKPKWLTGPGEIVADDGEAGNRRQDAAAGGLPKIETGDRAAGPAIINTRAEWRSTARRGVHAAGRATGWVFRGRNPWKMAFFIVTCCWILAVISIPFLAAIKAIADTANVPGGGGKYLVQGRFVTQENLMIGYTYGLWFFATGIYILSSIFTLAGWFAFGKK